MIACVVLVWQVEAKRALPKDESPVSKDQQAAANGHRTKKIFVGGLPPTVDDETFRRYFGEFGEVIALELAWLLGLLAALPCRGNHVASCLPAPPSPAYASCLPAPYGVPGYCSAATCIASQAAKGTRRQWHALRWLGGCAGQGHAGSASRLMFSKCQCTAPCHSPGFWSCNERRVPRPWLLQVDDAVVMYDHENKRPRGFGFITFTGGPPS